MRHAFRDAIRNVSRCALLLLGGLTVVVAPALAQDKTPKKEMDAFERQKIVAKAEVDPVTGKLTIDVEAQLACYPNGTSILVTVHYIQGLTNEEQAFGDPEKNKVDGTSRRIATTSVIVRDWRYQARFVFDKYCPPGEYVITGFYRMNAQSRRARRTFIKEYVPAHERTNPCRFCRFHYGLAKVAVADPKFRLRPEYAKMEDKPLWLRQKLDYADRMLSTYKDWYAQILGARETMVRASHRIIRFGPHELQMVHEEVGKVSPSAQEEMHAILSWKAVQVGLQQCAEYLKTQRQLPQDPYRYWRLLAYGDGHPPEEDLRDPSPARNSPNRPWTNNYIIPRLNYVQAEMTQHGNEVAVLILPNSFFEIRNLCGRVKSLVGSTDKQIDIAVDTILNEKRFEAFENATDEGQRQAISKQLNNAFYDVFHKMHVEKGRAMNEMEKELERMAQMLSLEMKFPVATWPMPTSVGEAPQNPAEERDRLIQQQFGSLMQETKRATKK